MGVDMDPLNLAAVASDPRTDTSNISMDDGPVSNPTIWAAMVGPLALAALYCAWLLLPVDAWVRAFAQWIESWGSAGAVAFALVLILGTAAMLPGAPLSIAAGVAYGWWALPLVYVSVLIGATLAFVSSRYFFRASAQRFFGRRRVVRAVISVLEQRGWKIALLVRLSPVLPFNIENYFWGVTRLPFWAYLIATGLGILPGTCLDIYLGIVGEEAARSRASIGHWALLGLGLAATCLLGFLITRQVREMLRQGGEHADQAAKPQRRAA
jgi:uncharacterized membrane protein YdjX (TVP38/TMEM64 family)